MIKNNIVITSKLVSKHDCKLTYFYLFFCLPKEKVPPAKGQRPLCWWNYSLIQFRVLGWRFNNRFISALYIYYKNWTKPHFRISITNPV